MRTMNVDELTCARCAETIEATAKFCKHCGRSVSDAAVATSADNTATARIDKSRLSAIAAFTALSAILLAGLMTMNADGDSSKGQTAERIEANNVPVANAELIAAEAELDAAEEAAANAQRQAQAHWAAEEAPSAKYTGETDIVTLCELTVKEALATELDMDFGWSFAVLSANERRVVQGFKAQNAFGATIKHKYICTFDINQQRVTTLTIEGPGGSHRVI